MHKGLDAQKLKFCQLVADDWTLVDAFKATNPNAENWTRSAITTGASRLARREAVANKIEELRLKKLARLEKIKKQSRDFIMGMFMEGYGHIQEAILMAKENEDYPALISAGDKLVSAADKMGKFYGLNVEPDPERGTEDLREMSDAELARLALAEHEAKGTSAGAITQETRAA